jgi:hypothetical protein
MRTLQLAIVAALAVHSTAYAQMETRPTAADRAFRSQAIYSMTPNLGPKTADRILRNANECAPGAADAVWDGNANLLGYSCHSASANGG